MTSRVRLVASPFVCVVCISLAGCNADFPGKPLPADRPVPQNEITDFATLFKQNCTGCHGADGQHGPAPPLNDPLFLALVTPADLEEIIRNGRPGTPMPAFATEQGGTLTAEQVTILANGLKDHWPIDEKAKEELAAVIADAPPYLASQGSLQLNSDATTAGAAIFERACAECHGPNGAGGEAGYTSGAINDRAFLALISNQALRRIIITGRHDLGMPNYAQTDGRPDDFKPLTSEEIDELVALLASWRRDSPSNANANASMGGPDTRPRETTNSQRSTGRVSGSRQRQEAASTRRPNHLRLPSATPTPCREELERLVNHSRQGVGATH